MIPSMATRRPRHPLLQLPAKHGAREQALRAARLAAISAINALPQENIDLLNAGGVDLAQTDVDDLISFSGEDFRAINIDTARLEGLELAGTWRLGNWNAEANMTLQSTEDRTTGQPLLRRPERKGSITLDYRFDSGSWLGMEWFHSCSRNDFGGITLAGYDLVNLRAGWRFAPSWRTELRGENLGDADYEPAYGFNAPGRSWFISLSWIP